MTIAESTPSSDIYKYQRKYPYGPEYAPVTGYNTLYSQSGIEYYENSVLNGSDSSLTVRNFIDLLTGKPRKGANVTVTINSKAQNAAWNALQADTRRQAGRGGRAGPADRRDPGYGLVPELRPQRAGHPRRQAAQRGRRGAAQAGRQPAAEPGHQLHLAAGLHVQDRDQLRRTSTKNPGSSPQTNVYSPTQLTLPQTTHVLTNNDGEVCGNGSGQTSLITAFAQSCDTTFGSIGMTLGGPALNNAAELFGMNDKTLRIPMPVTPSNYVIPPSKALTAFSAIGQYSDTVTPLQEAMFSAAVADGGKLMTPYLVKQVTASDLSTVDTTSAEAAQPGGLAPRSRPTWDR